MGCGCGGKKRNITLLNANVADGNPDTWGPALWAILHILAERIGKSGMDVDQSRDFYTLITLLPSILPCTTCQSHMKMYLAQNPFVITGLVGTQLHIYSRTWLLNFHNAVRASKGQTIDITTLDQLTALYGTELIQACQIQTLNAHAIYGVRMGYAKMDTWKRWNAIFQRLKVMVGA
jgi:hypothetical protein